MNYFYRVIKRFSSYISMFLLLCLALEYTALNVMHSHDDDHHEHHLHATIFELDVEHSDSTYECIVSKESHEEACKVCELLLASHSQTYSINTQPGLIYFSDQADRTSNPEIAKINFSLRTFAGRAPPRS